MSLHISNLSSRVRINEIERVFRRFGHCNVNLKNGYGFVVYGVPAHAEKALKVLRGTSICGETISISWSKQQPRSMHSLSRNNRLYELQRGSKSGPRSDISNMKVIHRGPRGRKNEYKDQDTNGTKTNHGNKTVSMTRYNEDNNKVTAGEDRGNLKEDCRNESENVRKNFKDNDRWEQGVDVLSSDINGEQEHNRDNPNLDFADDKNVDENLPESHSGSSPSVIGSQNKIGSKLVKGAVDNLDKSNSQQCFDIHGQPGNKVQSCSGEKGSQKKKLRRLDYEQDNEFEGDMEGLGSRSREKLKFSRDFQMRHPQIDRKVSSSRRHHRLLKRVDSRIQEETQRRDWKKEYVERKHSKEDDWGPERHAKKVSGLVSSSVCSAHTASMSHSKSRFSSSAPRSDSVSRSRSKSLSSQACSPSTKPEQKNSGSGRKEARSRSSSPASFRSVSLGPALPSLPNESLNNTLINQGDNLKDVTCPDATDALVDQEEPVEEDAGFQSLKYEDMQMEKISEVESLKDSNDAQEDHIPQDENNNSAIDALLDQEEPVEVDAGLQSLKYENMQMQKISEMEPLKDSNYEQEDHMNPQDENNNNAIDALLYLEEPVEADDGTQCLKHENMQMENISAVEPLKKSNDAQEAHIPQDEDNNSSMENPSELQDDQYPDAPKTVKTFPPSERTDSKALMSGASRSCSTNPARISPKELCIVLKHYGLDVPAEDKKDLSVEAYFGSARLWPWQVIYYRRLKKGSISTENYARRVAQNQEFGIVDKYIRSGSGWGELGEEDYSSVRISS